MEDSLRARVNKALDEIRPYLMTDGGNISLVDIPSSDTVRIRLEGSCISCEMNRMTFTQGVVTTIKKYAPEITNVLDLTPEAS